MHCNLDSLLIFAILCCNAVSVHGGDVLEWKANAAYVPTGGAVAARQCIRRDSADLEVCSSSDTDHEVAGGSAMVLQTADIQGLTSIGTAGQLKFGTSSHKCVTAHTDLSGGAGLAAVTMEDCCTNNCGGTQGTGGAIGGRQMFDWVRVAGTSWGKYMLRATGANPPVYGGTENTMCLAISTSGSTYTMKIDRTCAASSGAQTVLFKKTDFNWLDNTKIFELKNTAGSQSSYSSTAGDRLCTQKNTANDEIALAQCSVIAAEYTSFLFSTTTGPSPTLTSASFNPYMGRLELDTTGKCLQGPSTYASDTHSAQLSIANCATTWDFYWIPAGTVGAWVQWRVAGNQLLSGAVDASTNGAVKHCLEKASTQVKVRKDCTTAGLTDIFWRFAGLADAVAANAAINDDPEVVNMHKEKFKVNNKGGITLLHLPRQAPIGKAYLVLVAEIQELYGSNPSQLTATGCTPTFVRNLLITGTALGDLTAVTFHARNNTAPFLMGFGNHLTWLPDGKITESAISHYIKDVTVPEGVSFAITAPSEGYPRAITLAINDVKLTVRRPHIPEGKHWQFINFQVNGLDTLRYNAKDFGGVLGFDSPSKATSKQNTCLSSTRKWKKSSKPDVSLAALSDGTLAMVGIDSDEDMDMDSADAPRK